MATLKRGANTFKGMTGQRFGRLSVICQSESTREWKACWECRCDCGVIKNIRGSDLRSGLTRSCGCLRDEVSGSRIRSLSLKHGLRKTREYNIWQQMIARCSNSNHPSYHYYGARGIQVCPKWKASFEAFLQDMGAAPSMDYTLDRFPQRSGNYETGNCRWATATEQSRNRDACRMVEYDGKLLPVSEWAEVTGLTASAIYQRLNRGWDATSALTTPLRKSAKRRS